MIYNNILPIKPTKVGTMAVLTSNKSYPFSPLTTPENTIYPPVKHSVKTFSTLLLYHSSFNKFTNERALFTTIRSMDDTSELLHRYQKTISFRGEAILGTVPIPASLTGLE
jgi:hypothetical protein